MKYFDLLHRREYFDRFLNYFNSYYDKRSQSKEIHYSNLIKRHYSAKEGKYYFIPNRFVSLTDEHIDDIYESLRIEFGMGRRGAKLVSIHQFRNSLQSHSAVVQRLSNYRIDSIKPSAVPQVLSNDLELLFRQLKVVPSDKPLKLVAVSKTLHFLLPSLVMPVDGANVLRFLKGGNVPDIPQKVEKQLALFWEVFKKYADLSSKLQMRPRPAPNSDTTC
jgi:hypothetical protein